MSWVGLIKGIFPRVPPSRPPTQMLWDTLCGTDQPTEKTCSMKRIRSCLTWVVLLVSLASVETSRAGAPPTYLVIQPRRPEVTTIPSPATRYSYGWFGAQPRQHHMRHFGYYKKYTQWS